MQRPPHPFPRDLCCALAPIALALSVMGVGPRAAAAQSGTADSSGIHKSARVARARVITKAPVINGRLDDEAWQGAEPFGEFVQRELQEGAPVTERTEVR